MVKQEDVLRPWLTPEQFNVWESGYREGYSTCLEDLKTKEQKDAWKE